MSYPLLTLTLHRMEYCFRWVWEAASASLVVIHSYPDHIDVSVTTKHILLQWACNRHLSMVELPHATRQAGKTEPGVLLQGLLLDHSGMEGVFSRITFESSGLRKQE